LKSASFFCEPQIVAATNSNIVWDIKKCSW
jgi:hypothetical protein